MEKKCNGCKKTLDIARFQDEDKQDYTYAKCHDCRLKLKVKNNFCSVCGIQAIYNFSGRKVGVRCASHKEAEMVNVKDKICKCGKARPTYNKPGEKVAICCTNCKENDMVDVKNKMCKCGKAQPTYNKPGEKVAICCANCKEDDMVNVKDKMCKCGKSQPTYNKPGEKVAICCANCKEDDMVDILNKMCKCGKSQPSFNKPGEKVAICCTNCKEDDMVNVVSKRCKCGKALPVFNKPGEKVAICCANCKEDNMVDVKNKRCKCGKALPAYNKPGEKVAICCANCKEDDMVNVKSKICVEKSCRKQASYALPGMSMEYCATHKKVGMIFRPRKSCEADECKELATHGSSRNKPVHCEEHKTEDEYNLCERECLRCQKLDVLNKDGLCVNFCSLEEKDWLMKKRVKKDEEFIGNLLQAEIDIPFAYRDQVVDKACSNKRPDFVYHCGSHVVAVEVDEDQHKSYRCTAYGDTLEGKRKGENIRMFEISQSFDGLPVTWIRYNPDGFKVKGKVAKYTNKKRHELLIRWVRKCIRESIDGVRVKYLFYDDFSESDANFVFLTEKDVL